MEHERVAVIVPCLDEAATIAAVVADFRAALPGATVYVYDNGSSDDSVRRAAAAGAIVRSVQRRGKGRLLRRALLEVEAGAYVLVDGDGTYDATVAPLLLQALASGANMAVGSRCATYPQSRPRVGHGAGNRLVTGTVNLFFGERLRDVLSGFRAVDRRFARTMPALAGGFEVEIMMTMHALEIGAEVVEIESRYLPRPAASASKLRTGRDGARIVWTLLHLGKQVRPFLLFGSLALAFASAGLLLGAAVIDDYLQTGLVARFPTAILAAALEVVAAVSLGIALVLDSVASVRRELKRIAFQTASVDLAAALAGEARAQ